MLKVSDVLKTVLIYCVEINICISFNLNSFSLQCTGRCEYDGEGWVEGSGMWKAHRNGEEGQLSVYNCFEKHCQKSKFEFCVNS